MVCQFLLEPGRDKLETGGQRAGRGEIGGETEGKTEQKKELKEGVSEMSAEIVRGRDTWK